MSSRVFSRAFALLCGMAIAAASHSVSAQIRIVEPPSADAGQLRGLIEKGDALEASGHWADALTHYEEAMRQFPNDRTLTQRYDLARVHYDIARRYRDASYRQSVATLSEADALRVYQEIGVKIDANYVTGPDWNRLVERGNLSLQIALGRDEFLHRNLRGVDAGRIKAVRDRLPQITAGVRISNRSDAEQAVGSIARYATREIGLAPGATVLEYAAGAVTSLDPYSSFLTADQLRDVFSQIEGNFVGLGVELKADGRSLIIVDTIKGSPAEKAGIRAGDRVLAVDGRSTEQLTTDGAAELLQGKEGSVARLRVMTPGSAPRDVPVRRAHVEVPSIVQAHLIDQDAKVAYLKLASFQKSTSRELSQALWDLHRQGMRSLIVDVRGNPGGLLTASVEAADKFITSGTIVSTNGRSARERFNYQAHQEGSWRVPLVVMVDGDSASASEIFAGAIQDHHRGTIVGRRSYGKGSVQGIFPLRGVDSIMRCGVRLTTAKFYAPSGRPISHSGITPDVNVRVAAKPIADTVAVKNQDAADADLQAALQVARQQLTRR